MIAKTVYSEERERCVSIKKLRITSQPTYASPPPSYDTAVGSPAPKKKELSWLQGRFDAGISSTLGAVGGTCLAGLTLTNPVGWAGLAVVGGFSAGYVAIDYMVNGKNEK